MTALMVVGAIVLGAILLVPMSLAANGTAPGDNVASANGDCDTDRMQVKDQAKDGSCDQCDRDQDMVMQQNQTRAQDGSGDGCVRANGTCDQVREQTQMQNSENCGQLEYRMQNQERASTRLQDRPCTMSQCCMGKA
jgi:hypothetical protein